MSTTCTGSLQIPRNRSFSSHCNQPCSCCTQQWESFSSCSHLHIPYLGYQNVKWLILVEVI